MALKVFKTKTLKNRKVCPECGEKEVAVTNRFCSPDDFEFEPCEDCGEVHGIREDVVVQFVVSCANCDFFKQRDFNLKQAADQLRSEGEFPPLMEFLAEYGLLDGSSLERFKQLKAKVKKAQAS